MTMLTSLLALLAAQAASVPATPAVAATVDTPVLTRIVERGEVISSSDFAPEPLPAAQARGALQPRAANGMEAARRLAAGTVVRASDVTTPRLVRRGEAVTITVRSGGLTITTAGRTLDNGAKGDRVRVVANSTSKTLDAEVEGSGAVRVVAP